MHFQVMQEGVKLVTPIDQVVYAGLFLTRRTLK